MIIDGGPVGIGVESTIIDVTEETPTILRPGHITKDMIAKVIGTVQMDAGLSGLDPSVKPKAPGMKYRHYAPKASMTVIQGEKEAVIRGLKNLRQNIQKKKWGFLLRMKRCPVIHMDKLCQRDRGMNIPLSRGYTVHYANLTIWGFRLFFLRVLRMMTGARQL